MVTGPLGRIRSSACFCARTTPIAARAALGELLAIGDVDQDDLEHLIRNRHADSAAGEARNGASGNGAVA